MNVSRIQELSKQHADLLKFHIVCLKPGVEFSANDSKTGLPEVSLDYTVSKLIASDIRVSLIRELEKIETVIKAESNR